MKQAYELPQFELHERLGTGGTATVYKVFAKSYNQTTALKTTLDTNDNNTIDFVNLAQREFDLISGLDYPGLVSIKEIGIKHPYYILLEYCPGKTLENIGKIDNIQAVLNILSSIAVNLEFIHSHSIIHADLKPDNIFLPLNEDILSSDSLYYTKLSDFSLGKFEHESDKIRAGLGTLGYMAPETIDDNKVTYQSDLFALGVIAYQILTGVHPFITEDADPVKINSRIKEESPIKLESFRSDIPEKLLNLVAALLEKSPLDRPKNAIEVCHQLREAGAAYPFEKALLPKYFISSDKSFSENKTWFDLSTKQDERVDMISGCDNNNLRTIAVYNYLRNNLIYSNRRFRFQHPPYIPFQLIKESLKAFCSFSYSEQKSLINEAIVGGFENAERIGLVSTSNQEEVSLLCHLLPSFLSAKTIKRVAKRLSIDAEKKEMYKVASELFILSGNLHKAENCAYQAAVCFKKENRIDDAVAVLNKVIDYAKLTHASFDIKSLYMLKGDYLKDTGNAEYAEKVYYELIELYKGHNNDELLAETYKDLGDLYKIKQQSQKGIEALTIALEIYRSLNNELEISHTYNNLGNIYWVASDYQKALQYYRKALRIQRKLKAAEEIASTVNNIGSIHVMSGRFARGIRILNISLDLKKSLGNKGEIARTLNNLGFSYYLLGENAKAVDSILESLEYNRQIGSKKEILFNLENLTTIMLTAGQLKQSIGYLKEGISLSQELNDKPHIGSFNVNMGAVLLRMGKISDACNSFKIVDEILTQIDDVNLQALLSIEQARLNMYINNKKEAIKCLDKAYKIANSLNDKNTIVQIHLLSLNMKFEQQLYNDTQNIIDELKIKRESNLLTGNLFEHYVQQGEMKNVEQLYETMKNSVDSFENDIEQSNILNKLTLYNLEKVNLSKALEYVQKAKKAAQSKGLVFDLVQSIFLEGRINSLTNEYEKCYTSYRQALQMFKSISNQLTTAENKAIFQDKKEILFLVDEIKKLSNIIGQKKEQVR